MEQLKKLLDSLTLRQKISLVVAAAAVIALLFGLGKWNKERDFELLYAGVAPEDAGQLVERLRERGVEYRLSDNGTSILVPSALVAEVRLHMAAAGLPRSGRLGFELFDETSFGATDFAEKVNYHRALEGELERSVTALAEVEMARVHITLPKDSVFLESRRPAKGSVMIRIRPGAKLSEQNVQAICYLVSSAVEGLEPGAVSVLDMRGNLLNRSRTDSELNTPEPSEALLAYRQSVERDLLRKIQMTLEPLLGADGFRAGISVECDFSSGEQSEEYFDPERSVMKTSQRSEDVSGAHISSGGIPGTASSLPRTAKAAGRTNNGHTRRTENIAYQTSRTVRRVLLPQGDVKRLSVSLLVDHEVRWQGEGDDAERQVSPPTEEKLLAIRELVSGAVGLRPDRGDRLIVESLPFESTRNWQPLETPPPPPSGILLPPWLEELVGKDKKILVIAGGVVLALLVAGVVFGFMLLRKRGKRRIESVSTKKALPQPAEGGADGEGNDVQVQLEKQLAESTAMKARLEKEALESLKIPTVRTKKAEVLTKHLSEEAQQDPVAMAQLVRTWLNEEQ